MGMGFAKRALRCLLWLVAGAVGLVYGLLWAKELAWRAGPIRHTALAITVAGALGRCLIPRGSRPKR